MKQAESRETRGDSNLKLKRLFIHMCNFFVPFPRFEAHVSCHRVVLLISHFHYKKKAWF